jgi:hypothetical protein
MCMRRRIHVCSTGEEEYTEDECAAVEPHGGGAGR